MLRNVWTKIKQVTTAANEKETVKDVIVIRSKSDKSSNSVHTRHQPMAMTVPMPTSMTTTCNFNPRPIHFISTTCRIRPRASAPQHAVTNEMIVSITGATGFIGRRLVKRLLEDNHKIQILTRSTSKAKSIFPAKDYPRVVIVEEQEWAQSIQGSTAVVNLAGTPIGTRWSSEVKADIKNSRVSVTSKVVDAINTASVDNRPSVLVNATAVGYYGTSEMKTFDETSPSGNDYLSEVCREWEAMAQKVDGTVRLVLLRIGIVLDKDGGALAKIIPLFMMFAGGPIGTGKQWFSWIHRDDLVNLIVEAISNPAYKGVINGTAPNPVRFAEMCDSLGNITRRPSWLPVPELAVKTLLGEGACTVLDGQRVVPKKAQKLGFQFKYHHINDALKAILSS